MEKWQLETAERLASIERSIKYIEVALTNQPTATIKLEERVEKLEEFRKYILIRIAWISGAFAVIASGLFSAFDNIKNIKF